MPAPPFGSLDGQTEWLGLLAAARQGDDHALGELCDRLRSYLLLTAQGGIAQDLKSKLGASDIVQETMLEACRDFEDFQGMSEQEFRGWFARLVRNTLLDTGRRYHRAASRDTSRETSLEAAPGAPEVSTDDPTASQVLRRQERDQSLEQALLRLPERSRRLIELRHRGEKSFAEIGDELGMNEAAARQAYKRALTTLRTDLATS